MAQLLWAAQMVSDQRVALAVARAGTSFQGTWGVVKPTSVARAIDGERDRLSALHRVWCPKHVFHTF